jgi:FlaA1/EpsC-like NDP-sugar epimerase
MQKYFKDKIICITGGSGSLGQELVKRILPFSPKEIIIFSRNEKIQHEMRNKYPELTYVGDDNMAGKTIHGLCIPAIFEVDANGNKFKKLD